MVGRRRLLATAGAALAGGLAGCTDTEGSPTPAALRYSVPAFADGTVPARHTCDGEGVSPRVVVDAVPPPTESLALICTFPDDVASQVTLWTMWNLPPDTAEIPADVPAAPTVESLGDARQGTNARGDVGYLPICPPPGEPYDHWLTLYACRREIALDPGASRDALAEELETATLASRRVVASYTREPTPSEDA
ncbi:YbhB/YbcL family Raf kinase inhibitor-like protein [Halosegnis marinus]|uniref:YbhB/YbcL family Raf kinase inhibitor-like protein n=1 Tax=Halosegnis marinus TaxID=3034023 RepID=A0ABD5ZKJ0_9EURY|nr:YbhB/YbcL family Raf kinase inhibitor-like protein [Halosegnis sp. DT85]